MSSRLATHHVAKENFAGHKISRAVRQSQAAQRQKEKRLVAMSQRRGNLLEEAKEAFTEEAKKPAPKLDRRQQLEQWKKKRERVLQMQKMNEKKPFKAGSINVTRSPQHSTAKFVLSTSLTAAPKMSDTSKEIVKPKKPAPKNQPPQSTRTLRSASRPQAKTTKEFPPGRATRSSASNKKVSKADKKGHAAVRESSSAVPPSASDKCTSKSETTVTFTAAPANTVKASTVPPSLPTNRRSDIFHTIFPNKFSPFQFNFTKKLNLGTAFTGVTVRGQRHETPPEFHVTRNSSPALWPPTPSRFPAPGQTTDSDGSAQKDHSTTEDSTVNSTDEQQLSSESDSSSTASHAVGTITPSKSASDSSNDSSSTDQCPRSVRTLRRESYTLASPSVTQLPDVTPKKKSTKKMSLCYTPSHNSKVAQFRQLLAEKKAVLCALCEHWTPLTEEERPEEMSDEVVGKICTAIGQAKLLMNQRFAQFSRLCDGAEDRYADKATHSSDLQGFWDMIGVQIDDVEAKFQELKDLQSSNWVKTKKTPAKRRKGVKRTDGPPKKKAKTPSKATLAARERMRRFREEAKRKMEAESAQSSDSVIVSATTPPPSQSSMTASDSDAPAISDMASGLAIVQSTPQRVLPNSRAARTPVSRTMQTSPQGFDFSQYIKPAGTGAEEEAEPMDTKEKSTSRRSLRSAFEVENITASDDSFTEKTHLAKPLPSQERLVEFAGVSPAAACSQRLCQLQMNSDTDSPKQEFENSFADGGDCGLVDYIGSGSVVSCSSKGGDLISFDSPAPAALSSGAFVVQYKPVTPVHRGLNRKVEDSPHILLTPVRRSKRLHRKSVHALSSTSELPSGTPFSIWPNNAL